MKFVEDLSLFFVDVLTKEIILPALAAAWYEEPVVVESDIVASQLIMTITVDITLTRPLQQELIVVCGGRGLTTKYFMTKILF